MRNTLIALTAMGAAGCVGPEQVWMVQFGETEVSDPTFNCTENLSESGCPESASPEDNGWTTEETTVTSPGLSYVYVHDTADGGRVLVADGRAYIGEKDGGDWVFTWENRQQDETDQAHDSGYTWHEETDSVIITTFTLDIKGDTFEGEMKVESQSRRKQTESDQWDRDEVGFYVGRLDTSVLTEGPPNLADESNCTANACEIEIRGSQTQTTPLTGMRTTDEQQTWDGLSGVGQQPGVRN